MIAIHSQHSPFISLILLPSSFSQISALDHSILISLLFGECFSSGRYFLIFCCHMLKSSGVAYYLTKLIYRYPIYGRWKCMLSHNRISLVQWMQSCLFIILHLLQPPSDSVQHPSDNSAMPLESDSGSYGTNCMLLLKTD